VALTVVAVAGVVVLALLAIAGIAALIRSGGDDGVPAAATTAPRPSDSNTATEPPSPAATASEPVATAPPGLKPIVHTYTGNGSKVLKITKPGDAADTVLVTATYRGGGNFSVFALDSSLHRSDILVNVVGKYTGANLLDSQGTQTSRLKIQASGPWTVKIKQTSAARRVSTHAKGTGDDVLLYTGTTGVATFDYRGTLNFVVRYGDSTSTLVDEVGRFLGQVPIKQGPVLIDVSANGAWSMRVQP
jgi:hypothetical protein